MDESREDSPDWLRSFQAPELSVTTLSSDSEPSSDKSPARDESIDLHKNVSHKISHSTEGDEEQDEIVADSVKSGVNKSSNKKTTKKGLKTGDETAGKKRKRGRPKKRGGEDDEDVERDESLDKQMETPAPNHLVWDLSSDSESNQVVAKRENKEDEECSNHESSEALINRQKNDKEGPTAKVAKLGKSPKKRLKQEVVNPTEKNKILDEVKVEGEVGDVDVQEEGVNEKHVEPRVSSSTLPLILPEKVHRLKALVECEGESIDLSGDMGAVGRVIIPETPSREHEMFLDLKGTIYKTTIVPSRTFCVVSIGQSEAKIEAIMNDFIQLTPQSNVYDAETMVEGTLDGFSFDSEDEGDKMTKDAKADQNEGEEGEPIKKTKGKAEKKMGATQKKGKAAAAKQPKKRKPLAPKRGRAKK